MTEAGPVPQQGATPPDMSTMAMVVPIPKDKPGAARVYIHKVVSALLQARLHVATLPGKERVVLLVSATAERLLQHAIQAETPLLLDAAALRAVDVEPGATAQPREPIPMAPLALPLPGFTPEFITNAVDSVFPRYDPYSFVYAPLPSTDALGPEPFLQSPAIPGQVQHAQTMGSPKMREASSGGAITGHGPAAGLYLRHTNGSVLSAKLASQLLHEIVQAPLVDGGAGLSLSRELAKKRLSACFPLHDKDELEQLRDQWLRLCTSSSVMNSVRRYFGEAVAYFFAFSATFGHALMYPAALGVLMFIWQQANGEVTLVTRTVFSLFVVLWSMVFLRVWRRKESLLAMQWGTSDFEEEEQFMPEFIGNSSVKRTRSLIDGRATYAAPRMLQGARKGLAMFAVSCLIGAVIVLVSSVFLLKVWFHALERDGAIVGGTSSYLVSIVTGLQIQITSMVYRILAQYLTKLENQATYTAHRDSLILKLGVFEAINNFISLFYIAVAKRGEWKMLGEVQTCAKDGDGNPDCMGELQLQISMLYITKLVVGNFIELALPWLKSKVPSLLWRCRAAKAGDEEQEATAATQAGADKPEPAAEEGKGEAETQPELPAESRAANKYLDKELAKADWEEFQEYLELLIAFGYVTLFSLAFPLGSILAFLSILVEQRVDSTKICYTTKRPLPIGAQDIGSWNTLFTAFAMVSVLTNGMLLFYTNTEPVYGITESDHRFLAFIILEHCLLAVQALVWRVLPEKSWAVALQHARAAHLISTHLAVALAQSHAEHVHELTTEAEQLLLEFDSSDAEDMHEEYASAESGASEARASLLPAGFWAQVQSGKPCAWSLDAEGAVRRSEVSTAVLSELLGRSAAEMEAAVAAEAGADEAAQLRPVPPVPAGGAAAAAPAAAPEDE